MTQLLLLAVASLLTTLVACNHSVDSDYQTEGDGRFILNCPTGKALSGIWSKHYGWYNDRRFSIEDVPADGKKCADGIEVTGSCHWSEWANSYDNPMEFSCPFGSVITGMESDHNNFYDDRIFKFNCCKPKKVLSKNCYRTRYTNDYDHDQNFKVPEGHAITGVSSVHHNHFNDRIFRFDVCSVGSCTCSIGECDKDKNGNCIKFGSGKMHCKLGLAATEACPQGLRCWIEKGKWRYTGQHFDACSSGPGIVQYGEEIHIGSQHTGIETYLDTCNSGACGGADVSTSSAQNRDPQGSGIWKIIGKKNSKKTGCVKYGDEVVIQNKYASQYMDTCKGSYDGYNVGTATGTDRDNGSGTWVLEVASDPDEKVGECVKFNVDEITFRNGYAQQDTYLNARGGGGCRNGYHVHTSRSRNYDQDSGRWKIYKVEKVQTKDSIEE